MTDHDIGGKQVLMDCRWLRIGGAGRATELLLRGLGEVRPPGRWLLWGPPAVCEFLWAGAEWRESRSPPRRLWGQRDALRVPRADIAIYVHQIRPLRPGRSITLIHDTIPLRYGSSTAERVLKRAFLRAVARESSGVVTVSEHSKRGIEADLGVPPSAITVVHYPVDRAMVDRVQGLRARLPQRSVGLYVGRFAPHKNLHALIAAFQDTEFRRGGGALLLRGGSPGEVDDLRRFVTRAGHGGVTVKGSCTQATLEELYATSRFLVMPSLEEGFGLPAWEAIACGLPVCVSDGGALPEITRGFAEPFPARSMTAMASALDRAAEREPGPPPDVPAPSMAEFAATFVDAAERAGGA